jgi:hypothetical protein
MGRLVPGGQRALRELAFHLERDADRWAVSRNQDALSLASAICKSVSVNVEHGTVLALSGSGATDRVTQLLDDSPQQSSRARRRFTSAVAASLAALTLLLVAAAPLAAVAGADQLNKSRPAAHCRS